MKVLYLTAESYQRQPIIKSQVETLLEELSKNNYFSTIVYTTFEPQKKNVLRKVNDKLYNYQFIDRGAILNFFFMLFYLIRNMKEYNIIHCRSDRPMLPVLIVNFFFKKKIIYDPRGLYGDELLYHNRYLLGHIFKILEYFFYKMSSVVVVVSIRFKTYIKDKYNIKKVLAIPTFSKVTERDFKENYFNVRINQNWKDNILFVYSGAYEKWQLIDRVMKLFHYINNLMPTARFVVFSKDRQLFEKAFQDYSISSEYYFIGTIKSEELTSALSACDYGIILRDNNIINQVASPIKIKDYLLAGLQIICTDSIGDDSDFVRVNNLGIVIESLDDDSLLNSITLVKDRVISVQNKLDSRNLIMNNFSVIEIAHKYCSLYKKYNSYI